MTDNHLQRFVSWVRKHYRRGNCRYCDFEHDGYHSYASHLRREHPDEYKKFVEWAGIKEA